MIYWPTSKVFKEAAAISYARSIAENDYSPEEKRTMAEFQELAMAKIYPLIVLGLMDFFLAAAALSFGYIVGTISLLPVMSVFLLLAGIEITSVALCSQVAYLVPVHISYFRPKESKAFLVQELDTPMFFKKYALVLALCLSILSIFLYEYCTSKLQCAAWLMTVSLTTAASIWYLIISVKSYVAVNNAILRQKRENEQWIRDNEPCI